MKQRIAATLFPFALLGAAQAQEAPAPTQVQEAPAADAAAAPVTYNAALTSDYRYRGISQSHLRPALQGGADWTDAAGGWYAGTWLSTIEWTHDAGGGGHVEWDIYGGKRGDLGAGFSYDVGLLGYVYPGNGLGKQPGYVNANTGEIYAQVGRGPVTLKYSNALTNLFGFVDSRYSSYLDLSSNLDVGDGWSVILHGGRQHVTHVANASYTDWKAGVSKAWGPTTLTLAWYSTNADPAAYTSAANGKFLGRGGAVLSVQRTF